MSRLSCLLALTGLLALWSCDSSSSSSTGPSSLPKATSSADSTFIGRWRIYAIPADTVEFQNNGKGKLIVDLGFRVAVDSFQWSASGGAIHLAYADGKTEDGTYRFFGKDSFNMTLSGLGTQLYLRLK
ncbi:MAG: hypothetical protein IPN71_10690 [Fibrobacteres bacterium]|nr:hypothetical protein [Fibrobacterota bacterium]